MAISWSINTRLGINITRQLQQQQFETGRYPVLQGLSSIFSFPLSHIDRAITDMKTWRRIGPMIFILNSLLWGLAIYLLGRLLVLTRSHKQKTA
jgi:hypothetical protein